MKGLHTVAGQQKFKLALLSNKPFNDVAKRFFRYDALCYDAVLLCFEYSKRNITSHTFRIFETCGDIVR
jgi:hypothetical protein